MPSGEVTAPTPEFDSQENGVQAPSGAWGGTGHRIFSLAVSSAPPLLCYYFSSFCKMLFSDNFKSAFPTKLATTKAFYMEILEPQETVETGK